MFHIARLTLTWLKSNDSKHINSKKGQTNKRMGQSGIVIGQ